MASGEVESENIVEYGAAIFESSLGVTGIGDIELEDLFGQPIPYVYAELQRRIEEALLNDDRITNVHDFDFSNNGGDVLAVFQVDTIYGTIKASKEVQGIV